MPIPFDNSDIRLPDAFFTPIEPTPVMIRLNHGFATELGLDVARLDSPEDRAIMAGNQSADGCELLAMTYSGHQCDGFSTQLGNNPVRTMAFQCHLKESFPGLRPGRSFSLLLDQF